MRAAVAGTFNVFHAGHKALIDRAFELGEDVFIGITSDEMASSSRDYINPINIRRAALIEYLSTKEIPWLIFEIDDVYGPPEFMDTVDVLVVSEETAENGKAVCKSREERKLDKMELEIVSLVETTDGEKMSSSDIILGKYGRTGNPDVLDVAVGSTNRIKIEAVRTVFERVYGDIRITSENVSSNVPEQPFEEETCLGAENRAKAALKDHDISVGIEAGVFEMHDGLYDIQHCVIIDAEGKKTIGMGSGFRYPDEVAASVRNGKTVSEAMNEIYGKEDIGHNEGAIGFLTKGILNRKELTEQSVLAALVPRMNE